ncbi:hypothetical protein GCM10008090_11240 [Arenicella chitinivorans]|uniref:Copper resistance protein B n=1 Tax=Arenicella chitinivorans TaxID=1329800 RepID=A0A918RL58_9GAMM|nr:copper resistance protein B [Arenicella chitinivorans]GHA03776.1 hypothetical protein GCM10008090_11240 [Arenicella chitinivorans]
MTRKIKIGLALLLCVAMPNASQAMFNDDPWLTKVMSEFEYLSEHGKGVLEWDIDAWHGRDLSKFWLKTSGELVDSDVESANIELVYSHAVSAYWDQQFGIRHDLKPDPLGRARNWLSYGFIGTAPYFIEVDARVFVGEESSSQLLIELERELMLTQEWVLTPELDIVANGRSNEVYGEGSGLAEIEFGLRLGYEHNGNRKFQPFVGITAKQSFGTTRQYKKSEGEASSDVSLMLGIHSWF